MNRRDFLASTTAALLRPAPKALVSITLDLEMSRNFPRWEDTHWDYEKGNLNEETKRYTVEACRRVKAAGGVLHCFVVGRVLEQEDVSWLAEIHRAGHPLGNHTYDHVNVRATEPRDIQFRFARAPWLIGNRQVQEVIAENIRLTSAALTSRLGITADGFRTPGGFVDGLADKPQIRRLLLDLGYKWVSSKYPGGANPEPGKKPDAAFFRKLEAAQLAAQPFKYADGLVEVPMSPVSDIGAFRIGRWQREWFAETIGRAVDWAIDRGAVFDFLGHPSCLYVADPNFTVIDMICAKIKQAGERASLVGLGALAERASEAKG